MHLTAKINEHHVEQMPLTISITMSVADWRSTMRDKPPLGFGSQIAAVLGHITRMSNMTIAAPDNRVDPIDVGSR